MGVATKEHDRFLAGMLLPGPAATPSAAARESGLLETDTEIRQ